MAATAAEVQRQVEAAVAGDLQVCEVSRDLSAVRHWLVNITCTCACGYLAAQLSSLRHVHAFTDVNKIPI